MRASRQGVIYYLLFIISYHGQQGQQGRVDYYIIGIYQEVREGSVYNI